MTTLEGFTVREDLNIASTRKRFIKPLLSDKHLQAMVDLELLCFPPPTNYDLRTLRNFCSINGSLAFRVYPVEEPERLVGFHIADTLFGELITLDVHPDFRRRGVGRWLVGQSLAMLKKAGHGEASCQIATANEASLALHAELGFAKRKRIKNYYGPGHDAFLLRAKI